MTTPTPDPRYVWIVHYDNYGDQWISGVFDSEEKALAYVEEHDPPSKRISKWNEDYRIEKERLH